MPPCTPPPLPLVMLSTMNPTLQLQPLCPWPAQVLHPPLMERITKTLLSASPAARALKTLRATRENVRAEQRSSRAAAERQRRASRPIVKMDRIEACYQQLSHVHARSLQRRIPPLRLLRVPARRRNPLLERQRLRSALVPPLVS